MSADREMKPCPFCAGDAVDVGTLDAGGWTAECGACGSSSGVFGTLDEAVAAWNIRRADMTTAEQAITAAAVTAAAVEFVKSGTVLTMCERGPCQRVVERKDGSDPQAKLIAAIKAMAAAELANIDPTA